MVLRGGRPSLAGPPWHGRISRLRVRLAAGSHACWAGSPGRGGILSRRQAPAVL
jgi:hypothetical protein